MSITKKQNLGINIIKGALILGAVCAGVIGTNIIVHAYDNNVSKDFTDLNEDYNTIDMSVTEIENEQELMDIVNEHGTQIIVD